MQTQLTKLVALFLLVVGITTAQTKVWVPDQNFRTALINSANAITQGTNDTVIVQNISAVRIIEISSSQITNLQGIEKFTALQTLDCSDNPNLSTLNVSTNTALEYLDCSTNANLSTLNVSGATALQTLDCSSTNLTSLNVSTNTALEYLDCSNNANLSTLNVSGATALLYLYCSSTNLTSLNVSTNTALQNLYCSSTKLTTLDISTNTSLQNLNCSSNANLTTIYVLVNPPSGISIIKDMSAMYVVLPSPTTPIIVSPVNNATNQSLYPTLTWKKVSSAHKYFLHVVRNNVTILLDTTLTDTSKQIGPLLYNTTYAWGVRAQNIKGNSPYSSASYFTTLSAPTSNYSSTTIDFGNVGIGSNKDMSFAVQCMGGDTLKINTINIANSKFMVVGSSQYNIPFTQTSNITIKFTPNGLGKDSTQIILTSNTTKGLDTLKAYGTGTLPTTSIHPEKNFVPTEYSISQNYPNPFNPSTLINYQLPISSYVTLKVYDMLGKEVATLVNGEKKVGVYEVNFDGSQLSGGIYFYRLTAGKFSEIKKMVLVK